MRCTRAPEAVPGHATAVAESTRFAGPPLALRLAMAGSEVPAIDGPAGQGAADGAVVVLRSDRRDPPPAHL